MKRTFVLCTASLLVVGFATLVASFESSDYILSFCNIKEESDATLVECLKKQSQDIENARLANPRNNTLLQMLLQKNIKCFPEEKSEKKSCYITVFKRGLLRSKLFSDNYISLFFWFRRNTYAVLSACEMTKANSDGVFSCLENIEKEAAELIISNGRNGEDAYSDMVSLVNKAILCYGGVTAAQEQCLLQQTSVLQTKFTTEINQQRNEMKAKLSSCQISDEVITKITNCREPLDAQLIDLSFQMLRNPELASSVQSLWQERRLCTVEFPKVKMCLWGGRSRRSGMFHGILRCKSSINPFNFDAVTKDVTQYIKRTSSVILKLCGITMKTQPSVHKCLMDKYKADPDVLSKDPKTAFIAMMKLVNVSGKCFEGLSKTEKMCLDDQKQQIQRTLKIKGRIATRTAFHILGECNPTEKMQVCVKAKMVELMTVGKSLLTDPLTAEKIYDLGSSLKTCLNDDPVVKACVLDTVMTSPMMNKNKGLKTTHLFHADELARDVISFINLTSSAMLTLCDVSVNTEPNVFVCLGEKYKANTDVLSTDAKTAFIAMMKLVKESAKCFTSVSKSKKMCLYEQKQKMQRSLELSGKMSAKTAFHILDVCKATPEMELCVKTKVEKLLMLGKTMLTNPSIAGQLFDLVSSLKTCLDEDIAIQKCVLGKNLIPQPYTKWYGKTRGACRFGECDKRKSMKEHVKEKLMKMLADCQVTEEKTEEVFNCLKEQNADMDNLLTKNYKQTMFNGMNFIMEMNKCIKNLSDANKLCLSNKKKEMMTEMTKKMEELMDTFLNTCGVTESGKPALFKCMEPKRKEMKTLLSQLFDKNPVLPQLVNLAEGMKECFDSEPNIGKCIQENSMNYYVAKLGKYIRSNSMTDIYCRINDVFKKCQVNVETEPDLYDCMKLTFRKMIAFFSRKDIDAAALKQELQNLKEVAMHCFANTDGETQKCLKKESAPLESNFFYFRNSARGFNTKDMMKSTDKLLAKCDITVEKSPTLKKCLDDITIAVLEMKPWLPMTDKRRELLKLESIKYWKCFKDIHEDHRKCMVQMVDSFSNKGSSYDKLIDSVASKCKECSDNKCFQNEVENAAKIYKTYMKAVMGKEETISIAERFRETVVKASICLLKVPTAEKTKTFSCLAGLKTATFKVLEMMAKSGTKNGLLIRKRRDADDDNDEVLPVADDDDDDDDDDFDVDLETDFNFDDFDFDSTDGTVPLLTFMNNNGVGNGQQSSSILIQILFTDKSLNRVNTMFNLMQMFISTCTQWAPRPDEMRSRPTKGNLPESRKIIDHSGLRRQIIDHGGLPPRPPSELFDKPEPVPKLDAEFIRCQQMYDDINSFINTGEEQEKYLKEDDDKHERKSVSKSAAIGGTVGAVICSAIIVPIFVIFCAIKNGRCSRKKTASPCVLSCVPSAPIPSIYSTMPLKQQPGSEMPPSYNESIEEGKLNTSVAGLSQILDSSTGESTEKSC